VPTYEYKCDACGHAFEAFQPMSAAPIRKCPSCGKSKVKRLIGAGAGLIFKGSGFYITDYRESGYAEKAKADATAEKPAEKKESGSSSTEPAAPAAKSDSSGSSSDLKPAAEAKPAAKAEPAKSPTASPSAKKGKR
jgi:putative FmdB family regulatory protein